MCTGVSPQAHRHQNSLHFVNPLEVASQLLPNRSLSISCYQVFLLITQQWNNLYLISLERRWSSRTFRYGYLVTTSPQLSVPPSTAPSFRLGHRLRVLLTPMVWRAVCTRPGNVFTATCWFAITSDSSFMQAGCSLQSELGLPFWALLHFAASLLFVTAIVARVKPRS